MACVRSKNTSPETATLNLVKQLGFKPQLHVAKLPGTPDIVFKKLKSVILVHGCFWHQHSCSHGKRKPATNQDYWLKKFARNAARDRRNKRELKALGWKVLVVWECHLKKPIQLRKRLAKFLGIESS